MKTAFEDVKKYILSQEEQGRVVVMTIEGFSETSLDEIIKQHTDGLLYDLNRDRATILTLIEDKKWVNDYACMLVIKKLKQKLEEHDKEIKDLIDDRIEKYRSVKASHRCSKKYYAGKVNSLTEFKNKLGV